MRRTLWIAGQVAIMQRTNRFRDKFERYIAKDRHNSHLRRKAYTAIAAPFRDIATQYPVGQ